MTLRKGQYYRYKLIWDDKDHDIPKNWITATPIRLFGKVILWKFKIVKDGYEHLYFTDHPNYKETL
jgi:hypothetical protein